MIILRFAISLLVLTLINISYGVLVFAQEDEMHESNESKEIFSDINSNHENYDAIMFVHDRGFVDGYTDGTYRPDETMNRAEFTKILVLAAYDFKSGSKAQSIELKFSDVNMNAWYFEYVTEAVNHGVIKGYEDDTFKPENDINFAEAAKIVVTAFNYKYIPDEKIWYKPYVTVLEEKRAIPSTIRSFDQHITRGEMAEIVYRIVGIYSNKESQTYDSIELSRPQKSNEDTIQEGLSSWKDISSYKYSVSMDGEIKGPLSEDVTFDFIANGAFDINKSIFIFNFDGEAIFNDEYDEYVYSMDSEFLFDQNATYFQFFGLNIGDNEFVSQYVGKSWKISLPPGLFDEFKTENDKRWVLGDYYVFKDVGYIGIDSIEGEESHHYKVALDKEAFLGFVRASAAEDGEILTDSEMEEARNDLDHVDIQGEVWIGMKSGILNKLEGEMIIKDDNNEKVGAIDFVISASEFNTPVAFTAPREAEEFPVEDLIPVIMMGEMEEIDEMETF